MMHTDPPKDRLIIARDLRRYLSVMGPREAPVAITQRQADQLAKFHYLEIRGVAGSADRKRLWFEGHELRVIADEHPPGPDLELHARDTDPETSHQALAAFARSGRALAVLRALLEHGDGDTGMVGAWLGRPRENCSPVFCKLERAHLIEITHTAEGDKAHGTGPRMVYAITDAGRLHLTQIALELAP